MFVQTGDFVNEAGLQANSSMTFYGQEKVEYNAAALSYEYGSSWAYRGDKIW